MSIWIRSQNYKYTQIWNIILYFKQKMNEKLCTKMTLKYTHFESINYHLFEVQEPIPVCHLKFLKQTHKKNETTQARDCNIIMWRYAIKLVAVGV